MFSPLQTVSVASELRRPVYRGVASRCIDFEKILQLMATVKWDIKDIMSQHSAYVDVLLQVRIGIFYKYYVRTRTCPYKCVVLLIAPL